MMVFGPTISVDHELIIKAIDWLDILDFLVLGYLVLYAMFYLYACDGIFCFSGLCLCWIMLIVIFY